jgi:hypothetical protein
MSKHNRSPKLSRQGSKRHRSSRASNVGTDIFDDSGSTEVNMEDSLFDGNGSTPSTLEKVLDCFEPDDHVRYDRAVNEQMGGEVEGRRRFSGDSLPIALLSAIVQHCGEKLDFKYKDFWVPPA